MARVLGAVRLSRATDDSTSVARQRQVIQQWADQNGHVVIGWAEDVDVSGGLAPWARPELSKWLPATMARDASEDAHRRAWEESRAADFDIICVWRLDRLSRRVLHLNTLIEWCREHSKHIASASEGFDINSPMGKVFVQILGALAEGELEAIKERAKSSYTHLMKEGRWRGGFVPYGYYPVKQGNGEGWKLEIDPDTAKVVQDIVTKTLDGESTNSICRWLNEENIPTSLDAQRLRDGKPSRGASWRVGNLLRMLRSHTLLGYAEMTETVTRNGKKESVTRIVKDEDGMPLRRAEALITRQEWEQLQAALEKNSNKKAGNRTGGSPMLRIAYCECGKPMYRNRGRGGLYYRCASKAETGQPCGNPSVKADLVESAAEEGFLALAGRLEIVRRVFVPGSDYSAELAEADRALKELREDRAAGLYSGEKGSQEYREMYLRLEKRRETLAALPTKPDEWREEPTGQTYAQRWEAMTDPTERAKELRSAGVRVVVFSPSNLPMQLDILGNPSRPTEDRVILELPGDISDRIRKLARVSESDSEG